MVRSTLRSLPLIAMLSLVACVGTPEGMAANEERECRSLDITGSKIAKRECRTVSAWAKWDQEQAAQAEAATAGAKQNVEPNSF
ncbi:hypothetical protein ACQKH5_04185 [Hyphomonas sp. NPDC076900]|uniref:hypothetical protein n=1 Tax=unclassified Hyphomonas TaxID=2630699 RepID=UPI003D043850